MIFIIYSVYKFLRRVIASCLKGVLLLDVMPQVTPTVRHYIIILTGVASSSYTRDLDPNYGGEETRCITAVNL